LLAAVGAFVSSVLVDGPTEVTAASWEEDASVPGVRLPVMGPVETVSTIDVNQRRWELVAYRTSPTDLGYQRVCSEFRTGGATAPRQRGPQSCLSVPASPGSGPAWAFVEVVDGQSVFVVATVATSDVVDTALDGETLTGPDQHDLPVRYSVGALGEGSHTVVHGTSTYHVSAISGPPARPGDGTRQVVAVSSTEGAFWERLVSDDPQEDGWVPVVGKDLDDVGYLNPVELLDDVPPLGPLAQPAPAPVYDAQGNRVGWWTCGFSTERVSTCGSATTAIESR
jgi:hypothetical protein